MGLQRVSRLLAGGDARLSSWPPTSRRSTLHRSTREGRLPLFLQGCSQAIEDALELGRAVGERCVQLRALLLCTSLDSAQWSLSTLPSRNRQRAIE